MRISLAATRPARPIFDMGWNGLDCYGRGTVSFLVAPIAISFLHARNWQTEAHLLTRACQLRYRCLATILVALLITTGCKSLAPFGQSMRTRVAAARQWTENGVAAVQRGAVSEARDYFSKASSQLPQDHEIVVNLARTHFQEGQYQPAIKELNRAIKINGHDEKLLVELGQYLLADGQVDAASEKAQLALQKNHRCACAWLLSGRVHAARGDDQAALGDYQKAIGIDPQREDIQLEIVRGYRRLNNPLRALSAVENILEQYPSHQQPEAAILEKSQALLQLKQNKSALETLSQAIADGNQSPEIKLALSRLPATTNPQIQGSNSPTLNNLAAENEELRFADKSAPNPTRTR